ncbi:LOW QUALITY PROTEIN: transient receptor potential cation channel subfamily M member-like 2 [Penaeus chinensis]|uniref:LOW QUALITY PROTEIN: transient receptor potential cation channel subfamily M member-like 2 n=1 Tax=Penaeus chinensis TaxID=139456 RepID=UPI001FB60242|nr:LOW QUALITY PROTEIN: transient receptor potential cation channel subfamily M member-like 2 [Penaeus chinensis]
MSKSTVGGAQQPLLAIDPFNAFKVDDLTNYSMDDQRWTLQRKKIGLKRRTKGTRARRVRDIRTRDINLTFIRSHFTRKECVRYGRDPSRNGRRICFCGLSEVEHLSPDRLLKPISGTNTRTGSRLGSFQEEGEEVEEEIIMGDMNSMTSSIMGILGINGAPWGQPPPASLAPRGSFDSKSVVSDVEAGTDRGLPESLVNAIGITPRMQSRVYPVSIERKPFYKESSLSFSKQTDQGLTPSSFLEPRLNVPPTTAKWDSSTHIQELPTNAYGTIDFINETAGSTKPAKYIRLSDSTNIQTVLTLLTDYWRMMEPQRPQLVISVTGGADFLRLDGRKREIFSTGLMKAVKSTGAWILTGGLHLGVNRIVGEAVNESQYTVKTQEYLARGIRCLGVLPWGFVRDRHLLLNSDLNEFEEVRYKVQERTNLEDPVSLDGDHTHFLMVDDGTRDHFNGTVNFRTRLEEAIQAEEPSGLGIPVVVVLLEGGLGALGQVCHGAEEEYPCGGRGRHGAGGRPPSLRCVHDGRYILRRQYITQLMNKILAAMTELQGKTEKQKKCADYVLECCARANMIITFDIDCAEGLDHCILYALLTGGAQSSRLDQLSLALLWDRPDIAEHHIFPAESNWASWDLKDLMTTALLEEKVEFVKLFILNGLVMSDYLNVTTLRYLYNEACKTESHTHLRRLLQRSSRSSYHYLVHVHNILQAMLRKHHDPVYLTDTPQAVMVDSSINYLTFDDPYQELLLWAIFSRRGRLARFLWERCETPLCAAVVASCVYQSLWKSLGAKNTVILNEYLKQKTMFETLAVELQDVCYQEDPPNAMGLVERRNPKWGQMDCLELAHLANDLMFIATPCSQASVELNWRRGMTRAPPLAVTICNFLPFLVWTKLFGFQKLGDNGGELTAWQKLVVFYKSPISKFFAHSTSFVVFLLLYAYVILFDFKYEMSVTEILVICWIFTFIVGELSEITTEQSTSVRGKISDWLNSVWNRFDLMAIVLALLALALRLYRETFKWGRIAYSLNTTLFYCRLFRIYHVNYHLGPKLVIFYRMISEVLVFMALLVIFILGYGIASQGLMHPGRDVSSLNLTDVGQIMSEVLLTPYWQMYGELLLDDIKGGDVETCYQQSCTVPESCVTEGRNCIQDCVCENAREYTWAVNLMLFIYLIIGNIMLLNLLIAIFTYVFDEVQENSMEIWKFEMYRLIREYDSKPSLVPPFVVLEYVWRIMKAIWKVTCRKKKENLEDYMKYTLTSLKIFEKECIQTYLARVTAAEEGKLGNRVKKISEKIDKVSKYIEQREEIEEM